MKETRNKIKEDRNFYLSRNIFKQFLYKVLKNPKYYYYCYIKYTRLCWDVKEKNTLINIIKYYYYKRKKNKYSIITNLEFGGGNFGKNLCIFHRNITINPNSRIGDNCKLHGNNCIGNNGKNREAPIIGDNVDIGYGATIIGNIKIGSNVIIGANSLVNKDFEENNIVIAGNPAKIIKRFE